MYIYIYINGNTTLKNYCNFQVTPKKHVSLCYSVNYSTLPREIVINENVIFEEKQIANAFNNFFINIVQS